MTERKRPSELNDGGSSSELMAHVFKPVISGLPSMQEILREQQREARLRMQAEQEELEPA